jgi:hypothetical protein
MVIKRSKSVLRIQQSELETFKLPSRDYHSRSDVHLLNSHYEDHLELPSIKNGSNNGQSFARSHFSNDYFINKNTSAVNMTNLPVIKLKQVSEKKLEENLTTSMKKEEILIPKKVNNNDILRSKKMLQLPIIQNKLKSSKNKRLFKPCD